MQLSKRIERIADAVERPLWYVCGGLTWLATLLAFAAVIMRYGFGLGYLWLDEICRYSFITMVYLWAGPIVRTGEHIRLELFTAKLRGRWKEVHSLIVNVLIFLTCVMIVYWGTKLIKLSMTLGEQSESFVFYIWWLHTVVTLGMAFHAFFALLEVIRIGSGLSRKGDLAPSHNKG